jgi:hypothetical protein
VPPPPLRDTVAVNVTAWPNTEGLADDATVVVVPAGFTVWLNEAELAEDPALPEYDATIGWPPTANDAVVHDA